MVGSLPVFTLSTLRRLDAAARCRRKVRDRAAEECDRGLLRRRERLWSDLFRCELVPEAPLEVGEYELVEALGPAGQRGVLGGAGDAIASCPFPSSVRRRVHSQSCGPDGGIGRHIAVDRQLEFCEQMLNNAHLRLK